MVMEFNNRIEELKEILKELLPGEYIEENEKIIYKYMHDGKLIKEFYIDKNEIMQIFTNLDELTELKEITLNNNYNYEKLVKLELNYPYLRFAEKPIIIEDIQNKISYILSIPSDEFLFFILKKLKTHDLLKDFRNPKFRIQNFIRREETNKFIVLLRYVLGGLLSIRIKSEKMFNIEKFEDLLNSFKFHISYNLNLPIVETKSVDDLIRIRRLTRIRRVSKQELEPPKRKYIHDLIYYYQMGMSAINPVLKFISYYNIIEYFFEKVYNEELIRSVREDITKPDFSYKNDGHIQKLINGIKKKVSLKDGREIINEPLALKLTLQKLIPELDDLKNQISECKQNLIEYYKNAKISFSDGNAVDFEEREKSKIYSNLARRIYKTRNSIIHSKELKKRYTPFHDEKELMKEIPLIRLISEIIIINSFTGYI